MHRFEEMCHPPYSPNLAPSDYYMFQNVEKHRPGQRFSSNDELRVIAGAVRTIWYSWH